MRSFSIDLNGPRDSIACQSMVGPPTRLSSEELLISLWRCGRWQVYTVILLAAVFSLHYNWSLNAHEFVGASVTNVCTYTTNETTDETNSSAESLIYLKDVKIKNLSCASKSSKPDLCNSLEFRPQYDEMQSTIITEWSLVCERKSMADNTQALFHGGSLLGSLVFPLAADRYGRKPVHIFCQVTGSLAGVGLSKVTMFTQYSIVKFICGVLSRAAFFTGIVWAIEFFPSKYRAPGSMFLSIFWAISWLIFLFIGYFVREWRSLQLILSLPPLAAIVFVFLVPESLIWLVSKNKFYTLKKAIIRQANKVNREPFPVKAITDSQEAADAVIFGSDEFSFLSAAPPTYSLYDAVRCHPLRLWTIILSLNWFLTEAALISINLLPLPSPRNRHLSFFASGAVCIPVAVIAFPLVRRFGLRGPFVVHQGASAILLLLTAILPLMCPTPIVRVAAILADYSLTFAEISVLLITPEIFPTGLRMTGLGICAIVGGTGRLMESVLKLIKPDWLSPLLLGSLMLPLSISLLLLPDTREKPLPDMLDEVEEWAEEDGPFSSICRRLRNRRKKADFQLEVDDEAQDSIL